MHDEFPVTETWQCECGAVLPLQKSQCPRCQKPRPEGVGQQVYREELALQKKIRREFKLWRSHKRMKSLNWALCKCTPLLIIAAILATACFGVMVWAFRDQIRPVDIGHRLPSQELLTEKMQQRGEILTQAAEALKPNFEEFPDRWTPFSQRFTRDGGVLLDHLRNRTQEFLNCLEDRLRDLEHKKEIIESYVK